MFFVICSSLRSSFVRSLVVSLRAAAAVYHSVAECHAMRAERDGNAHVAESTERCCVGSLIVVGGVFDWCRAYRAGAHVVFCRIGALSGTYM
ncbi:membrane transporter [Gracilaria domingensis]|nr:membrane transporter [Gracilaria domingensis]